MRRIVIFLFALCVSVPLYAQPIASGAITFDEDVVIAQPPPNQGSLLIQVTGTWSATLTFEGSVDGITYVVLTVTNVTTAATATTTTANGVWSASGSGLRFFRVRASAYASGQADVTISAGPGGGASGGGGGGGGGSVTQGTDPWIVAGNGTAGSSATGVLSVQGIASGTALPVSGTVTVTDGAGALNTIVDSGTLTAVTSITNTVNTIGTLANDGVAAGTNRVPTLPGLVETSAPTRTNGRNAGLSFLAGGGARVVITNDAGASQTLATDATHDSAAIATGPQVMGVGAASGALPTAVTAAEAVRWAMTLQGVGYMRTPDPCSDEALKVYFPVDIVTATTTEIVNQSASNYFRLCSINLVSAGANNIVIVEDDTDACASPTAGLNGGVTAGEGWNLGSNGGLSVGNGAATVMRSSVVNRYVCIITSAAVQLSGTVVYTLSP